MSVRVAVTGATGFIGRHVVAGLSARGDQPTAIRRPYDRAALAGAFRRVDAVVHLAGVVSAVREHDFREGNVVAARIVAEASRDAGVPMVHISSLAAAGPAAPSAPRSEDDEPSPINAYGRTKLEGERAVTATTGLRWTILRPGVVYGPGDRAMRPLFRFARRGILPVVGETGAAYTFIYIADCVRAILAAVDRGAGGDAIFLGHEPPVSPLALMQAIREAAGSRAWIVRVPRPLTAVAAAGGDIWGTLTGRSATINRRRFAELYSVGFVCRVDRMRDRLGVVAETDLRTGLALAAQWYKRDDLRIG